MASDSPDTNQAVRVASRRVHRTRPGNPANDPVALALLSHLSRDDGSTNAWARPSHAAPALVFVDGHGPGPKTMSGNCHDARGAPGRAHTLEAMLPHYASHVSPQEALASLVYASPRSTGPPPASFFSHTTPTASTPPPRRSPGPATALNP